MAAQRELPSEGLQGAERHSGSAVFAEGVSGLVEVLMEKLSTLIPVIAALLASLPVLLEAGV